MTTMYKSRLTFSSYKNTWSPWHSSLDAPQVPSDKISPTK